MLRSTRRIIPFPAKTVLEDVLTRTTGYNDPEAYCPFRGRPELIEEQFKGEEFEKFNLRDCIVYSAPMDLNPSRIKVHDTEGLYDTHGKILSGWETLDDMYDHEDEAVLWFTRQLIGYRINSASPFNQETSFDTFLRRNGEGEEELEKESLMDKDDFDADLYNKIITEIPYLLKIIFNRSKEMKADLFSFTRAYAMITEGGKRPDQITPRDFEPYTLIHLKYNGAFKCLFHHERDQKGEFYPAARAFICGQHPQDEAYKACMKLISYYEILGINWADEDPMIYNADFIGRLTCTYLPTNEQYFSEYGHLDVEVAAALQPENIFKIGDRVSLFEEYSPNMNRGEIFRYIKDTINIRKLTHRKLFNNWDKRREELVRQYLDVYLSRDKDRVYTYRNAFEVIDGFIYTKHDHKLLVLQNDCIATMDGKHPNTIYTVYGMAIILPDRFQEDVYFVPIEECMERFNAKKRGELYDTGWYYL